ncbi:MAG TPA: ATP-binding protein, partial [archaeon]|nr:ATP-binding protein [archaeon]
MKFVNREAEMGILREAGALSKKKLYTVSVSGLRRVGKTRLLTEFLKGGGLYFFVNAKKSSPDLLDEYSGILKEKKILGGLEKLANWEDFFKVLFERFSGTAVFDEFQNFESVDGAVTGILQKNIDLNENRGGILLVFSGSLIGLLKKMFTGKKETLYGRLKRGVRLQPLSLADTRKMCMEIGITDMEEIIKLYGILGGFPLYYTKIEDENLAGKSFQDIIGLFFLKEGLLEDEVQSILSMEFGKRSGVYYGILEAIANGNRRLSDIAGYVRKEPTKITRQLNELKNYFELVDYEEDVITGKKLYVIKHPLVNFWFRFFNSRLSDYKRRYPEFIEAVKRDINLYIGRRFEIACLEVLPKLGLPIKPDKTGRHWGKIKDLPKGENAYEIDVVCLDRKNKEALFVECKWSDINENEAGR